MALTLKKPAASAAPAAKPAPAAAAAPAPSGGGLKFLKKGKEAQEVLAKEEHKAEQKAKNNVFRFFVPKGKESTITFLDGGVSEGVLDIPFYYEHNMYMNGKWGNFFICTQDEEPCPICEGGSGPAYVGVLTVIDHSEYVSQKDGKTHKDQVRLFVAKRSTVKLLQKFASKSPTGLRGMSFDVSRTDDKSPSVGDIFVPVGTYTEKELVDGLGEKAKPINYDELLGNMYLKASDLRKMGFGSMNPPVGSEKPMQDDNQDYSQQL